MRKRNIKTELDMKISLHGKKKPILRADFDNVIDSVHYYQNNKSSDEVDISFLVVADNEEDLFFRCLDSIIKQKKCHFEIIIVDNGLDEDTKEKLKKYKVIHIVTSKNIGSGGGRNTGSIFSRAPIIAFIDADGCIPDHYGETAIRVMSHKNRIGVQGNVKSIKAETIKHVSSGYDLRDASIEAFIDTVGNSVWRRRDFLKVGGFEVDLDEEEGVVLCYRMVEFYAYHKNQFIFEPELVLYRGSCRCKKNSDKKIIRNVIIKYKLSLFYPFLESFKDYYRTKKDKYMKMKSSLHVRVPAKKVRRDFDKFMSDQFRQRGGTLQKEHYHSVYFTVIITCFNLGHIIKNAINSVLRQSLNNVEIIVIDDASTDPLTRNKLDALESIVKVVRLKENSGVAHARNVGIMMARSEYILCLDADDMIAPTYLEKAKNIFDTYKNVGLVSSGLKAIGDEHWEWIPKDKLNIREMLENSPLHTASCFRKSLSIKAGMYDEDMRGYEDWNHWISIAKLGCDVRVIPEKLFYYMTRADSKVKTSNKNVEQLLGKIIQNHQELYEQHYKAIIINKHKEVVALRSHFFRVTGSVLYRIVNGTRRELKRIKDKLDFHERR